MCNRAGKGRCGIFRQLRRAPGAGKKAIRLKQMQLLLREVQLLPHGDAPNYGWPPATMRESAVRSVVYFTAL